MNKLFYIVVTLFLFQSCMKKGIIVDDTKIPKEYNVVWESQSKNSGESMPCGGGDLGMNVWVENGDLLFYVDRSGNIDENDQQLKSGRIRIHLDPNPFVENGNKSSFNQTLDLQSGSIYINGKNLKENINIHVWSEINNPVIHVDVDGNTKTSIIATFESWRNKKSSIPHIDGTRDYARWSCYGYCGYKGKVYSYPDKIDFEDNNKVLFYHQNSNDLVFNKEVITQHLGDKLDQMRQPTKNRIFGGVMIGSNMEVSNIVNGSYTNTPYKGWQLKSIKSNKVHKLKLVFNTEQTPDIVTWKNNLKNKLEKIAQNNDSIIWEQNKQWWNDFWNRSHIFINLGKGPNDIGWQAGRNFQLMRYMLACNLNGEFPTRFNGGFFTVDPYYLDGKTTESSTYYNPDFRPWGAWTAMNQRLMYWPMLKNGDFDIMKPQFEYYRENLKNAELRSKVSWNIDGSAFTEQINSGGLPNGYHYGWNIPYGKRKPNREVGLALKHTYYYTNQLEFTYMIYKWYKYCGKDISPYMPFLKSAINFHFEYYKMLQRRRNGKNWDAKGKLVLAPTQAAESYYGDNSSMLVYALNKNLQCLLDLPEKYISKKEHKKYADWLKRVPSVTYRMREGHKTISPVSNINAHLCNVEIPQLYSVFPYDIHGLGKPNLDLAINTWKYGLDKAGTSFAGKKYKCGPDGYPQRILWWSWSQQAINLARMGLVKEAKYYVSKKMANANGNPEDEVRKKIRFPAFFGPGLGCFPDLEWGTTGMIAIQDMLLQTSSNNYKEIRIFPSWPTDWDVDYKLNAPQKTTVSCSFKNGKIIKENIFPNSRKKDVVIGQN